MHIDSFIQKAHLEELVLQCGYPVMLDILDEHIIFLKKVKDLQRKAMGRAKDIVPDMDRSDLLNNCRFLEILIQYKKDLNAIVEAYAEWGQVVDFDHMFPDYQRVTTDFLEKVPKRISLLQEDDHFHAREGDRFALKAAKRCKKLIYSLTKVPEKALNLFRKVFSMQAKPPRPWKQIVHLRNITQYYAKELLAFRMKEELQDIYKLINTTTQVVWSRDESLNALISLFRKDDKAQDYNDLWDQKQKDPIRTINERKKFLQNDLTGFIEILYQDLESAVHRAGTIELPNFCFNRFAIKHKHHVLNRTMRKAEKGWHITRKGLFDDWGIDNDMYRLMFISLEGYYGTLAAMQQKLKREVLPELQGVKTFLLACSKRIEVLNLVEDQLNAIEQEKTRVRSDLMDKILPELHEKMMKLDYGPMLEQLMKTIQSHAGKISDKRAISRTNNYTRPFKTKEIRYVSPFDLITFESLPKLLGIIHTAAGKLESKLKSIGDAVLETGQIAAFGLESALDFAEDGRLTDGPAGIAADGIMRTIERVEQITQHCDSMIDLMNQDVYMAFRHFTDELEKFTDNSNIIEIRVRIIRGKALKRIKAFRLRLLLKIRQLMPAFIQSVRQVYQHATSRWKRISKKYGLKVEREVITTDLAAALSETQLAVLKLPFVYQRLFKIRPLVDRRFFLGRRDELQVMHSAYAGWQKGYNSPTLIVGEKGSGATTLVNIFLGEIENSSPVIRIRADETLCTGEGLVRFLNGKMEKDFHRIEEWTDYLANMGKTIIVLEDSQRLFLKKVNGFEALNMLNDLINKTGHHIFWIITCTEYAFRYLDATVLLSEHYRNVIRLGSLPEHDMIGVIDRRHKVSGYNAEYLPSASDLSNKKYKGASPGEQQNYLRNVFFSDLTRIARSNIRIALTYWILSIKEVRGSTLHVQSLKDLDLSFLNSLSAEKLFAIGALILHEMLPEEDFGKVLNMNRSDAGRILRSLFGDGILLRENSHYMINPLLYRKITEILKNKNLLH